jgi:hypothetical protein
MINDRNTENPMTRRLATLAPWILAAAALPAHATQCFTMFDAKNNAVLQSTTPPIDLSQSIGDQMRLRFPARYLIISDVGLCSEYGGANTRLLASPTSAADLLRARSAESSSDASNDTSGTSPANRTARVSGYERANGTYVQSYPRASAGQGMTPSRGSR